MALIEQAFPEISPEVLTYFLLLSQKFTQFESFSTQNQDCNAPTFITDCVLCYLNTEVMSRQGKVRVIVRLRMRKY